ncbi:hypothetical protein EDB89DRAFT_2067692 [Lactarius sanguifluus]|nr:hypothetical protein EDB89DRAFT_2067692 [Lactarius sanguifluus]
MLLHFPAEPSIQGPGFDSSGSVLERRAYGEVDNRVCKERPLPLLPSPHTRPRRPPISAALSICVEKWTQEDRPAPLPCITRRPVRAQTGVHQGKSPPPPSSPSPALTAAPFKRRIGVHMSKSLLPPPALTATPSRVEKGVHEGMPPPPLPLPYPLSAPPYSRGKAAHETPPSPPLPPRVPFACGARSRCRLFSPSPPALPLVRAAASARKGGTRGHATPGTTLAHSRGRGARGHAAPGIPSPLAAPSRTRGKGACEGTPPTAPPFPRWVHEGMPPRTCGKGACEGAPPPAPPFPICAEGVRTRARRPVRAERWHAIPAPTLPHSRGRVLHYAAPGTSLTHLLAAPSPSPRVVQQGRRGPRMPAFTAPAPRFARHTLYHILAGLAAAKPRNGSRRGLPVGSP